MQRKSLGWLPLIFLLLSISLAGCTATLAPAYDSAVVAGLTSSNVSVMEFFASVIDGTQKETFSEREGSYSVLIGRFDALELQTKARPMPENKIYKKINEILDKRGVPAFEDGDAPSATALARISETLVKMRKTDKDQGVTAIEVTAFKNQVSIYMDQALTYESFLER